MDECLELIGQRLRHRHILVVEDDASTVVMVESALMEAGCRVYTAQDIRRAHKIAATKRIDCALLDIGIGEDNVFSVADVLAVNKVPIIFLSGYDKGDLPHRYQNRLILPKPYLFADLARALVSAMNPAHDPRPGRERLHLANDANTGGGHES